VHAQAALCIADKILELAQDDIACLSHKVLSERS
jgi:hypothetical protein